MTTVSPTRLRKPAGLLTRAAFLHVQQSGRRFRGHCMGVLLAAHPGVGRIGFTVSKKVGNAVVRNRVRRRLKEAVRLQPHLLMNHFDVVVIAYPGAATASYAMLHQELTCLLSRAQAWASRHTSPSP